MKVTGSFIDLKIPDIKYGFFGINNSMNDEMLIEDGIYNAIINYSIPKTQRVNVTIKPSHRISLIIDDISGQSDMNVNEMLEEMKKQNLFDFSNWPIGDVTNDDVIDIADIALLLRKDFYGMNIPTHDLNEDGVIDIADIALILSSNNYSKCGVIIDSLAE